MNNKTKSMFFLIMTILALPILAQIQPNRPGCPVGGCPFGQICQNFICVNLQPCINSCPLVGVRCIKGYCFPFGAPCENNRDCPSGLICRDRDCVVDDRASCNNDAQCAPAGICLSGFCEQPQCIRSMDCPRGQTCKQGRCKVLTCDQITCNFPDTCSGGVCYRRQDSFCSKTYPRIVRNYCPNIRPTGQDCPNSLNPNPFNPGFCGITANGERIDYLSYCQACKIYNIIYVYNQPCSTVPQPCRTGEVCDPVTQTCGVPDLCKVIICQKFQQCKEGRCVEIPDYCFSQSECRTGYICQANRCIIQSNPCSGITCSQGEFCNAGQCISKCAVIRCKDGWTCFNGLCYQNQGEQCQDDSHCGGEYQCRSKKCCYDPDRYPNPKPRPPKPQPNPKPRTCDKFTNCGINSQCIAGYCVLLYCSYDQQCGKDFQCVNNMCQQVKVHPRPHLRPYPHAKPKPYPDPYTLTYPDPYSWQFNSPTPSSNNPTLYPVPVPPGIYPNPNQKNRYPRHNYVNPSGPTYLGYIATNGDTGNHGRGGYGGYGGYGGFGGHKYNDDDYGGWSGNQVKRCPNNPCGSNEHCLGGVCQVISTGNVCSTNQQCPNTHVCVGNYCRILVCDRDGDCFGHKCKSGKCSR